MKLRNLANNLPKCDEFWKKKSSQHQSRSSHPGTGGHVLDDQKMISASCRSISHHPWSQLAEVPTTHLSTPSWVARRMGSITCSRHPGGVACPHWQCVDWQLGTELMN